MPPGSEDQLLAAVLSMKTEVSQLNNQLRNYVKKSDIKRVYQLFTAAVVIGLVASFIVTILTVSGCFLSRAAVQGHAPGVCSVMPGYKKALERAKIAQVRNEGVFKEIKQNKRVNRHQAAEIRKLKERLGIQ